MGLRLGPQSDSAPSRIRGMIGINRTAGGWLRSRKKVLDRGSRASTGGRDGKDVLDRERGLERSLELAGQPCAGHPQKPCVL